MRRVLGVLHRWVGLAISIFLFLAATTGAIISWEREVDHWLNPQIFKAASANNENGRSVYELAEQIDRDNPHFSVGYLPLSYSLGNTAIMYVDARIDPSTGQHYKLAYNEIFVDPVTGNMQGHRQWGELSLRRECWIPAIYRFHYNLQLPGMWGYWFMGILAIVWTIDCFVALVISFPSRKVWQKSFIFSFRKGIARMLFDLHRSGGVWTWPLLLLLAVSSIYLNLSGEVFLPTVQLFSKLRESPYANLTPPPERIDPTIGREQIVHIAQSEAKRLGIDEPPGALDINREFGTYEVGFFASEEDHAGHGEWGWQPAWLYLDGQTGKLIGYKIPGTGTWGDHVVDLQFPIHTGRLLGTSGKVLVSLLGIVIAILCVTGVLLWARKHIREGCHAKPRSG